MAEQKVDTAEKNFDEKMNWSATVQKRVVVVTNDALGEGLLSL